MKQEKLLVERSSTPLAINHYWYVNHSIWQMWFLGTCKEHKIGVRTLSESPNPVLVFFLQVLPFYMFKRIKTEFANHREGRAVKSAKPYGITDQSSPYSEAVPRDASQPAPSLPTSSHRIRSTRRVRASTETNTSSEATGFPRGPTSYPAISTPATQPTSSSVFPEQSYTDQSCAHALNSDQPSRPNSQRPINEFIPDNAPSSDTAFGLIFF